MNKLRNIFTGFFIIFATCLALIGAWLVQAFQVPPLAVAVGIILSALLLVLINKTRIADAFERFRSGELKAGIFVLLLFCGYCIAFAAPYIEDQITSLVIRPAGTRTSDTNGLIRLYSANESNVFFISTNLAPTFGLLSGDWAGQASTVIASNAAGTLVTNTFYRGILISTSPAASP